MFELFGGLFGEDSERSLLEHDLQEKEKGVKVTRCIGCNRLYVTKAFKGGGCMLGAAYGVKCDPNLLTAVTDSAIPASIEIIGLRPLTEARCLCENCADILGMP